MTEEKNIKNVVNNTSTNKPIKLDPLAKVMLIIFGGFALYAGGCVVANKVVNNNLKKLAESSSLKQQGDNSLWKEENKDLGKNKWENKEFYIGKWFTHVGNFPYLGETIFFSIGTNINVGKENEYDCPLYAVNIRAKPLSDSFNKMFIQEYNRNWTEENKTWFFRKLEIEKKGDKYKAFSYENGVHNRWARSRKRAENNDECKNIQDITNQKYINNVVSKALSCRSNVRTMKEYPKRKRKR